jgi:LuxR family transcriptional regulator, maltose regulon positive regulatory protein
VATLVTPLPERAPRPGPRDLPPRLRPPEPAPTDLRRDRLVGLFRDDPAPVTLICAPAGSGKTSLLAGWVAASTGTTIAWLSLDRHDDDPGLLWTRILGALEGTGRFPEDSGLAGLVAPPGGITRDFIDVVVDKVAGLGEPVWLVLDDVHVLRQAAALGSLGELARSVTAGFRLVLVSRTDPPIGLPKLRLEGRVREARSAELAFTLGETAEFLAVQGLDVPEPSLQLLQDRTEGWAAGIKIATMAMQLDDDPSALIDRFGGDDHAVADYLISEVLTALPEDVREFLLRTSVCEELDLRLAQRLSGRSDAAQVLSALERDNTFTRRLGRGRDTYRYHDLLRTFLLAELRRTDAAAEVDLHRVAGEWHEQRGEHLRAMDHFAKGMDLDRFLQVAETHGVAALLEGRARWLGSVLNAVDDRARTTPVIALLGAAAAMEFDDLDQADRWLLPIDLEAIIAGSDRPLAALAATVAAARARYTPRVDEALAQLEGTDAGATGDLDRDLYALGHRGVMRMFLGRYEQAAADLQRAIDIARVTGRGSVEFSSRSFLAGVWASTGAYPDMREEGRRALELAERFGWSGSPAVAHAFMIVGWGEYLRGDTPSAETNVAMAVASLAQHNDPDVELTVRSLEVVVAGDGPEPFESMQRYRATFARLADAQVSPALMASALPHLVRICLDLGERPWAREFVEAGIARSVDPGEPALLRAMLLHDAGNTEAARRELETIIGGGLRCHLVTTEVLARLLAAEIESHLGHAVRAQDRLLEALELAEPLELVRLFLDADAIRVLLVSGQGRFGRREAFVQHLLSAGRPAAVDAYEDRLTAGELAVLRELPSLLSMREIAEARCVSINTVKSHLRSIYRKLGVSGRREAVVAARGRGLL